MKKGILRTAIFLALTWTLLAGMDELFTYLIQKDSYNKVWWLRKKHDQKYDFAFVGASRAYSMVKVPYLEKQWGKKKGINLGLDGSNTLEQYLIIKNFIANGNKAEHLFMTLEPIDMGYALNSDYRIWCFLPYIKEDPDIYHELYRVFGRDSVLPWRYVPFYRYAQFNGKLGPHTVANSLLGLIKPPFNEKGDLNQMYEKELTDKEKFEPQIGKVHPDQIHYLVKILELGRKHGFKVHLYSPPYYYPAVTRVVNRQEIIDTYIAPLCKKYEADYTCMYDSELSRNPAFFADNAHINRKGMQPYMEVLARTFYPVVNDEKINDQIIAQQ